MRTRDYFGYADGSDEKRYLGLVFGDPPRNIAIDDSSMLVWPEVAEKQIAGLGNQKHHWNQLVLVQNAKGGDQALSHDRYSSRFSEGSFSTLKTLKILRFNGF